MVFKIPISDHSDDESSCVPIVPTKIDERIAYLNGKIDAQAAMLGNQNTCANEDNLRLITQVEILQQEQCKLKESIDKLETESSLTKKLYGDKKENFPISKVVEASEKNSCLLGENKELLKQIISKKNREKENNICCFKEAFETLKNEKAKFIEESLNTQKEILHRREHINKLEREGSKNENMINDLSIKLSKTNETGDRLFLENGELKQLILKKEKEFETEKNGFNLENKNLQNDKCKLIEELSASKKEFSDLNEYNEKERKEKEKVIDDLTINLSKTSEYRDRFKVEVSELRHTIFKNQQKTNYSTCVLKKEIRNLKTKESELQNELTNLYRENVCAWKNAPNNVLTCVADEQIMDLIDYPVLTNGVHKWSILIQKPSVRSRYIDLGVVTSKYKRKDDAYLGNCSKSWAIDGAGDAWHSDTQENESDLEEFNIKGAVVTFTLDLSRKGTLSYDVDGESTQKIFTNMKSKLGNSNGFIPASALRGDAEIVFLGFETFETY